MSINKCKPKKSLLKIKKWISTGIITSIRNREKLFSKLRQRPFDIKFKNFYNLYRNMLNVLIKKSKQLHYQKKLQKVKFDGKKVWNIINEVIGKPCRNKNKINKITRNDGIITDNKSEICNELNNFFVNVGNNLNIEHNMNSDCVILNDNNTINDSIFLKPISSDEINKLLVKIKDSNYFYENGLTNYILKKVAKSISLPLSIIYNKSLLTGIYPSAFKKCIVIPLFKAGDKLSCGNYRPITLSLTLSKVFEKAIKYRLIDFLEKKAFFSNYQFGFRTGRSTTDALFKVDTFIRNNIDNNDKVMGIFLDVQRHLTVLIISYYLKNWIIQVYADHQIDCWNLF